MAVGVDQAGQQRPAAAVDRMLVSRRRRRARVQRPAFTLPSSPIEQAAEMLELAVGADLDAVDVADQRVGEAAEARERCGEREERSDAWRGGIALFARQVKG